MVDRSAPSDSDDSESTSEAESLRSTTRTAEGAVNGDGGATEPESGAHEALASETDDGAHYAETSGMRRKRFARSTSTREPVPHVRLAIILGLAAVVALAGLPGWLSFRAYESRKPADERSLFLQVGRQGALNLTTIDFEHADADVQRILNSATGTFYDDFKSRSQPFIEVVKQARSKSVGTISEAGVESESDNEAQVLVAVIVKSSNAGAAEQEPRSWRMRITVQRTGDEAKIANVRFVA